MSNANEKRIARNTLFLFGKMLLSTIVSLYTSRVVLETLGVDDFGIYNLVGGIVTIFAFLNGTMSAATMRFLNFEMGAGDPQRLRHTFGTSFYIHAGIAIVLVLLAETVGLWYVNTHLVIAPERMVAANWVYQFSILATIVTVMQIPFTAAIMAHEKMDTYAMIMLGYTFLKLAIVLVLLWVATSDNLIAYSAMFFVITLFIGLLYALYCLRHFEECRRRPQLNRSILKRMLSYSGWDLFGNLAFTSRLQGSYIILNNFGGTVLNAAASLAVQMTGTMQAFATTVLAAFRPQVVQQYAQGDYPTMLRLQSTAGRICLPLMSMMVVPVVVEMPFILKIWLKDVPEYTVIFSRLCMLTLAGEIIKMVIDMGIHATGRVMRLSIITGFMYFAELPVMYWLLHYTGEPSIVFWIHMGWLCVILVVETLILKYQLSAFSLTAFWTRTVAVPVAILVFALALTWIVSGFIVSDWLSLVVSLVVSTAVIASLSWVFCLDRDMRQKALGKIRNKLRKG